MKLASFRNYKHDRSDIAGIIKACGETCDYQKISDAVKNIYGGWEQIPEEAENFLHDVLDGKVTYESVKKEEAENLGYLKKFEAENKGILKAGNLTDILKELKEKDRNIETSLNYLAEKHQIPVEQLYMEDNEFIMYNNQPLAVIDKNGNIASEQSETLMDRETLEPEQEEPSHEEN
jgi:antitoxin component of RelBE/YafQ-DinJ toxin-antitoxin module